MLELIVLGEVPGTSIIITFPVAAAMLTIFVGVALIVKVHKSQATNMQLPRAEEITL